jgi:fructoselysine-6-P-deglycase FrlB-like protein
MESILEELNSQPDVLTKWNSSKLPKAPSGSIFSGAGDSYAAAIAAFYLSSSKVLAIDPYSLASSPQIASGKNVFFISVSGRTSSNVGAARRVRKVARGVTAITADGFSPLAKLCDDVLLLPFTPSPRSPGILSFTLSLLASLKLSLGSVTCDFRQTMARAREDSASLVFADNTTYFLGNGPAYSAAFYASAKVYELLGARAQCELLEQFSHMELFSLTKPDSVNIFSCFDPRRVGPRLRKSLEDNGFRASLVPSHGRSGAEALFHSVFLSQHAVLERADSLGLKGPAFAASGRTLGVSDDMIYR